MIEHPLARTALVGQAAAKLHGGAAGLRDQADLVAVVAQREEDVHGKGGIGTSGSMRALEGHRHRIRQVSIGSG